MWSMWNFRKTVIEEFSKTHEVSVIAPYDGYQEKFTGNTQTFDWGLNGKSLNILREIRSIIQLGNCIKSQQRQILICYGIKPILYASLLRIIHRPNDIYILMFAGLGEAFSQKSIVNIIIKVGLKLAVQNSTVVVLNPSDLKKIRSLKFRRCNLVHLDGEGLDVVENINFINLEKTFDFIYVGRLIEEKGIQDFLGAIIMLKGLGFNIKARVLGDFYHPNLLFRNRIEALVLEAGVEFLGFKPNPMEYIGSTKFLVLPSKYGEGLPRTIIEALSIGVVPIVYPNPGTDHVVINDFNGLVSDPNERSLAETMSKAHNISKNQLSRLSSRCIKTSERFNIKAIVEQYREFVK
jgi:glycosyltransferase involved in cell wall biosynthesis